MKIEDFTFKGRMLRKRKIKTLSTEDVEKMRITLLSEGKELFFKYLKSTKESEKKIGDWLYQNTIKYYDERIQTLPKDALYDLYQSYLAIESSEDKEMAINQFCMHASVVYSLDRWFRKKMVSILTQKRNTI